MQTPREARKSHSAQTKWAECSKIVLLFRDAQFLQLLGDISAMCRRIDLFDDVKNLLVRANDERCTARELAVVDAIGRGNFSVGIA